MSDDKLLKWPEFKSQKEEDEFWRTHDITQYGRQSNRGAVLVRLKDKDSTITMFAENEEVLNDPKLSEMINVRFDKKTAADLEEFARRDMRKVASLIRLWVMERLRDEKYELNEERA